MDNEILERLKELIDEIADYYDVPSEEETEEMRRLTGIDWEAEDLQMNCCEYWSHHSLEETAYLMLHGEYPPTHEWELVFWRYKPGSVLEDTAVYEKYRLGKGTLNALEPLPLEEILKKIKELFPQWQLNAEASEEGRSYRFDAPEQAEYWTDTHFWIFEYGRETEIEREHQILCFSCHNMDEQQINIISECMEAFQCPLHIREENNF